MYRNSNTTAREFTYPVDKSPTTALIRALATVEDSEATDLPPVDESLPTEALGKFVHEGDDVTVTFSVNERRITVHDNGRIVIRSPDSASESE